MAITALLLFWETPAAAYPWMIRHDYTSCAQCHADPSGGSLLTQYGRAQSEILLRTQYKANADEEPGKVSGFMFGAFKLPDELLLGGDFRTLYLRVKPEGAPLVDRLIFMQADLQGQITVDRFRANASIGYAHEGARAAALTRWSEHNIVSRTYWVGMDLGEDRQWLLRAGRMNLPFGIRNIEHTMWVRNQTRTSINDHQQHGVALAYNAEGIRAEVMAIAGNFQVSPDAYRDRGYSAYFEYAFVPKLAVGASSSIVHVDQDLLLGSKAWRHAHGLFWRWSPWKPIVVMAEGDYLLFSQPKKNASGVAAMTQVDVEPIQGVHAILTGEMLNDGVERSSFGVWTSAQWFFAPHLDVRIDGIFQRLAAGNSTLGVTSLLAQIHAFL
jgi:hypothetical protein